VIFNAAGMLVRGVDAKVYELAWTIFVHVI